MAERSSVVDGRPRPSGRCRFCGRPTYGRSTACKARRCPGYARLWAGDQRRKLFDNLAYYDQKSGGRGRAIMLAVTAPGKDVLPFNDDLCWPLGAHQHSGKLGCRVRSREAREWSRRAPKQWTRLHRRAYQYAVHRHGRGTVRMLCRVWEVQARGVLHVHPVLACGTAAEMAAVATYRQALERFAPQYGFGFVSRKFRPQPARAAAAYLSAYFCKGKKAKLALHESVFSPAMPRSIVHVSNKLTRATGCTMQRASLPAVRLGALSRTPGSGLRHLSPPARRTGTGTRTRTRRHGGHGNPRVASAPGGRPVSGRHDVGPGGR
jgi:hypothetical protein